MLKVARLLQSKLEDVMLEETVRDVRVPTDVMFGWAAPLTAVATPEVETEPTILDAFNAERPAPFPVNAVPTKASVSVPPARGKKLSAGVPVSVE